MQLLPGQRIDGRYRLLRRIGAGALGTVWSARNETIDKEVAIKLLAPSWDILPGNVEGFFRDGKASGKVKHPSVVQIFDLGRAPDSTPYVVMELLEAEKLDDLLERTGRLPTGTALRICAELAQALVSAHEIGLYHHRVEPANVLLHRDLRGEVVPKLIDFGISRLVDDVPLDHPGLADGALGPVSYLAPEQIPLDPDQAWLDARTDVWSLGVLLHHCLIGRVPFEAQTRFELTKKIGTPLDALFAFEPPIDQKIMHLVADCLQVDRSLRPTARVVAERATALAQRFGDKWAELNARISPRKDLLPEEEPVALDDEIARDGDALPLVTHRSNSKMAVEDEVAPISKMIASRLSNMPNEMALDVLADLEAALLKRIQSTRDGEAAKDLQDAKDLAETERAESESRLAASRSKTDLGTTLVSDPNAAPPKFKQPTPDDSSQVAAQKERVTQPPKSNSGLWIGIGLALVVIVVLAILASKQQTSNTSAPPNPSGAPSPGTSTSPSST